MRAFPLQPLQLASSVAYDFSGHASEFCDVDPVAAAGRTGLDFVQEDDAITVFDDRDMLVDAGGEVVGEFGEFKLVRGEQRQALGPRNQSPRDCSGQGEAVKGGRTAADLVDDYQ